jgi:two-component system sensor histidine kinase UhpB
MTVALAPRSGEDTRSAIVAAERDAPSAAFSRPLAALAAFWHRRTVRAQVLFTFVAITALAALLAGSVTILQARKSTRLEIAASLRMAEVLVGGTAGLLQQEVSAERFLANLPAQLRHVRHLRISVRDAAGNPVASTAGSDAAGGAERAAAPAWFARLIAPPAQSRDVPVMVNGQRAGSVLLTGEPSDEVAEVWDNAVDHALLAALLGIAAIGLLYLLLGRVLDPLTGVARGLADLEGRNYQVRLARPRVLELAEIADRFNALASALDVARAENARLSGRLITAQDDERRRTALELHDEVGPSLFGLKANATSIARLDAGSDAAAASVRERAHEMLAIIDHLQGINRSILNRLRPMALGHIPLGDLVAQEVRERTRQHPDTVFSYTAGMLAASYGDSVDLTIYRCVQEGLTNVVRHAAAHNVTIALAETGMEVAQAQDGAACLRLTIDDDGCGIDPAAPRGHGLTGMQERVEALGGSFAVAGLPGHGTSLRAIIPLRERAAPHVSPR